MTLFVDFCAMFFVSLFTFFLSPRRKVALKYSGAPCQKMPALYCSSAVVQTCPIATQLPSANSATLQAATRYVFIDLGGMCIVFRPGSLGVRGLILASKVNSDFPVFEV